MTRVGVDRSPKVQMPAVETAKNAPRDANADPSLSGFDIVTLDALVESVIIQDNDGVVTFMNRSAVSLFEGYLAHAAPDAAPQAGDSFGRKLPPLLNVDGVPIRDEERPAAQVAATGEAVLGTILGTPMVDGTHWFKCNAVPTAYDDGREPRIVVSFTEVTNERALAASLDAERKRFHLALDNAPIGMALVALDGTFIDANQALCDLVGRERDVLLASTFQEITHADDIDADMALLTDIIEGRRDSYRLEKRYLSPTGDIIEVLLAVAGVRPPQGELYFVAQVVDIGERKRSEQAQQAALEAEQTMVEKLRELDRIKTEFVSTVSHELRTPLTSTIGYLELLADGAGGELTCEQSAMIEVVERNSERLLNLIEDLLTISTVESEPLRYDAQPVDVSELLEGVVESMSPLAQQAGIELTHRVDSNCGELLGDRGHLERVLINIVGNAIKFTPSTGVVKLSAFLDPEDLEYLIMLVSDTGVGIPQDEQSEVFDRFFRTSASHANAVPGSGLGLAIASDLVAGHGGTIGMVSAVDEGTEISVRLPTRELAERWKVGGAS